MSEAHQYMLELFVQKVHLDVKFPCQVSVSWFRGQKKSDSKVVPLAKGVANTQSLLSLKVNMMLSEDGRTYMPKKTQLVVYVHIDSGISKAGNAFFDPAPNINAKRVAQTEFIRIERCPDREARLIATLSYRYVGQISWDAISHMSGNQAISSPIKQATGSSFKQTKIQPAPAKTSREVVFSSKNQHRTDSRNGAVRRQDSRTFRHNQSRFDKSIDSVQRSKRTHSRSSEGPVRQTARQRTSMGKVKELEMGMGVGMGMGMGMGTGFGDHGLGIVGGGLRGAGLIGGLGGQLSRSRQCLPSVSQLKSFYAQPDPSYWQQPFVCPEPPRKDCQCNSLQQTTDRLIKQNAQLGMQVRHLQSEMQRLRAGPAPRLDDSVELQRRVLSEEREVLRLKVEHLQKQLGGSQNKISALQSSLRQTQLFAKQAATPAPVPAESINLGHAAWAAKEQLLQVQRRWNAREQLFKEQVAKLSDLNTRLLRERNDSSEALRTERQKLMQAQAVAGRNYQNNHLSLLSKLREKEVALEQLRISQQRTRTNSEMQVHDLQLRLRESLAQAKVLERDLSQIQTQWAQSKSKYQEQANNLRTQLTRRNKLLSVMSAELWQLDQRGVSMREQLNETTFRDIISALKQQLQQLISDKQMLQHRLQKIAYEVGSRLKIQQGGWASDFQSYLSTISIQIGSLHEQNAGLLNCFQKAQEELSESRRINVMVQRELSETKSVCVQTGEQLRKARLINNEMLADFEQELMLCVKVNTDLRREYDLLAQQTGQATLSVKQHMLREQSLSETVAALRARLQVKQAQIWSNQNKELTELKGRQTQLTCDAADLKNKLYNQERANFQLREQLRRSVAEREEAVSQLARMQQQVFHYSSILAEKQISQ